MPKYKYKAKDTGGKNVKGEMTAMNEAALQDTLRKENLFLVSVKEADKRVSKGKKMKPVELSDFCRQLGTLIGAGVSLVRALGVMEQEEALKPEYKAIYNDMLRMIRQGEAFSVAMEAQGKTFPELLVNMFKAAEESGNLDKTAMRMSEHYQKEYHLASKVSSAMIYPKILCVVLIIVLIAVFWFIMPEFFKVFSGMELPGITQFMLNLSDLVRTKYVLLIIVIVAIILVVKTILKIPAVRLHVDQFKLNMPVMGKLNRTILTARFARTLSTLYTSGIPIATAMQISKNTIGNKYLESQFDDAIIKIRQGESLSSAIAGIDGFHKKLSSTINIGEETGSLDNMLLSTADTFDYEAENATSKMVAMLEPCMIVFMAVIVGAIMISVMIPLYSMYSEIENSATPGAGL